MSIASDVQEHAVFVRAKKEAFFGAPFLGSKNGHFIRPHKCVAFERSVVQQHSVDVHAQQHAEQQKCFGALGLIFAVPRGSRKIATFYGDGKNTVFWVLLTIPARTRDFAQKTT
jgi:hypothetical protein